MWRRIFLTALNLKEIPYDIKPVSLIKSGGEQHSNEFREINPMEQVPALHIDNHTLIESVSIYRQLWIFPCYAMKIYMLYKFFFIPVKYLAILRRNQTTSAFNACRSSETSKSQGNL